MYWFLTYLMYMVGYLAIGLGICITTYTINAFFAPDFWSPTRDEDWMMMSVFWPIALPLMITVKLSQKLLAFIDNSASKYKEHKLNRHRIDPNIVNQFKVK